MPENGPATVNDAIATDTGGAMVASGPPPASPPGADGNDDDLCCNTYEAAIELRRSIEHVRKITQDYSIPRVRRGTSLVYTRAAMEQLRAAAADFDRKRWRRRPAEPAGA